MQRNLMLVILSALVFSFGCSDSAEDRLQGTWQLDKSAMKENDQYKNAPDIQKAAMDKMFEMMKMEMTFDDGKMTGSYGSVGQEEKMNATYEVKSEDGDKLVLESTEEGGKTETVTCWVTDDKLTFEAKGEKFTLIRKD